MEEQKVTVTLGSTELQVFAGNMALVRYRRAGGDLDALLSLGKKGLSSNQLFLVLEEALKYLQVNQVAAEPLGFEPLANLSANSREVVDAAMDSLGHVPWLGMELDEPGELTGEGETDSSTSGPTPSLSSAGSLTASGS